MYLKRIYHQEKLKRDKDGNVVEVLPGAVKGVEIKRAGAVQRFSPSFIAGGVQEGWLSMGGGKITVTDCNGKAVNFQIVRAPGSFCCHCDQEIIDAAAISSGTTAGQKHVSAHGGKPSPDPTNPAGYRKEEFYTCVNLGASVNSMNPAEAAAADKKVRQALIERLGAKYRRKQ